MMTRIRANKWRRLVSVIVVAALFLVGCGAPSQEAGGGSQSEGYKVVATTTMLRDMAEVIGGEYVDVEGLMGPGIDPHLYKASAGDVRRMNEADLIVYGGLHLEGKMGEIFENLESQDKSIVCISDGLAEEALITDPATEAHDPHIWFDVMLWKEASKNLYDGLVALDEEHEAYYTENYEGFLADLDALDTYIQEQVALIPEESRVLVTAHDAFSYFGKAYGFEVVGLQGISTASEAGTGDVRQLADFIVERQIKALFVESSVPKKNIEALQEAVEARGFNVAIGGELYSDSLGSEGSDAETYIGTVTANVDTIVAALQ